MVDASSATPRRPRGHVAELGAHHRRQTEHRRRAVDELCGPFAGVQHHAGERLGGGSAGGGALRVVVVVVAAAVVVVAVLAVVIVDHGA
jgi:hypothetical protein